MAWEDLTKPQWHALEATCEPDPFWDTVCTWRGSSDPDAAVVNAKAADSLARLGLVELTPNPEYPNRLVAPTPEGLRVYRAGQEDR